MATATIESWTGVISVQFHQMAKPAMSRVAGQETVRRREFIGMPGGAAATWPLAGHAQQTDRMRRIGVLMNAAESDLEKQETPAAQFRSPPIA